MEHRGSLPWASVPWLVMAIALFAAPALAQPSYTGSAACGLCHKALYEKWKDTLQNKSQQEASIFNDPVVVYWAGTVKSGPQLRRFSGG